MSRTIRLPKPGTSGSETLEALLTKRRSRRRYRRHPIGLLQLSRLLWAGQGINNRQQGLRTAPSAGALFPLEIYCVVNQVEGLEQGVYKYKSKGHQFTTIDSGSFGKTLADIALEQDWLEKASVVFVFCSVSWRTRRKYGGDSTRYIYIEIGHAAQNILLQAESLELSAAVVGAFSAARMKRLLKLPKSERPHYILSVGVR